MSVAISRQQFFRGDFKGNSRKIRPPWSQDEFYFTESCTSCGHCIEICPEHILKSGRAGYPFVDFDSGECTFCGACAKHCETDALLYSPKLKPWNLKIQISDNCLAKNNVICVTCKEQCEKNAIIFNPATGGISQPVVTLSDCTGCGACYHPCPVNAISIIPFPEQEEAI